MIRLSQSLSLQQKMAPQLIQSLRLLQMTTMQLEQTVKQELELNPLLEEEMEMELQEEREEEPAESEEEPAESEEEQELNSDVDSFEDTDWANYLEESYDLSYGEKDFVETDASLEADIASRESRESRIVSQPSMEDGLLSQLHLADLSHKEVEIGEFIIGNIDDGGYLSVSVEEIAQILNVPVEEVERVLKVIQTFDPPGIGARDLQECLTIQLADRGLEDSVAMRIVENHLEDLKRRRYNRIIKALDVSEERIKEALDLIATLNPNPGYTSPPLVELNYITPDLIVEKVDDEFLISLNDGSVPMIRISPLYRSLLKGSQKAGEEAKKYVTDRLNSAKWLLNAIDQRRSTMLKVARYIVEAQRDFFEKGSSYLKPMVLQDVADAVEMHVSTISRVSNGKYIQTPHGVFELKDLFDGKLRSSRGEDVSATSVKERIKGLIDKEAPRSPLSDQQIAKMLQKEGVNIARRTVAKYRDQMGINSARYRTQL